MGFTYFLFIILFGLVIIFMVLVFVDSKKNYDNDDFPLTLVTPDIGEQYFKIDVFKWQQHKISMIRKRYLQNTKITTTDNFSYRIISYKGMFSLGYITEEIRFGLEPITESHTQVIQNINISITDSANINLKLNNDFDFSSAYNEIQDRIENDVDKRELLSYLETIYSRNTVSKENTSKFYNLLKKYESILSCASGLISAISSIISLIPK